MEEKESSSKNEQSARQSETKEVPVEKTIIEVEKSKLTEEIDLKPRQVTSKEPRKRRARRSTKEIDQNYVSDHQVKESSEEEGESNNKES